MTCPLCDDTGWKAIDQDGTRRVARCECWRERIPTQSLAQASIPPRYQRCEFSNFLTYPNDRLLNAVAAASVAVGITATICYGCRPGPAYRLRCPMP